MYLNHLQRLLKWDSDSVGLEWDQWFYISDRFPNDADVAGPWTTPIEIGIHTCNLKSSTTLAAPPHARLSSYCFLTAFPLFLHSFIPWRSLITETCWRASIVSRLRSQNGLGQNGFSNVKNAMPGSFSPGIPYPICLETESVFCNRRNRKPSRFRAG